jgi:uncharacterized protein DUF4411
MAYLLDANVFIEAKQRYYPFDVCPAFWEWLEIAHDQDMVFSIEKVYGELVGAGDELSDWAKARGPQFFLPPDADVLNSLTDLSAWAAGGDFDAAAVTTFLDIADSYLVAHAHAHDFTVVTHETVGTSRKKIKIPNACVQMGVTYRNTFEMLRVEGAEFVLPE